jgi:hypothetical protein
MLTVSKCLFYNVLVVLNFGIYVHWRLHFVTVIFLPLFIFLAEIQIFLAY